MELSALDAVRQHFKLAKFPYNKPTAVWHFLHYTPNLAAPEAFMLPPTNQAGTLPTMMVPLCLGCCTRHTAVLSGRAQALNTGLMPVQMKPLLLQQLSPLGPLPPRRMPRQVCLQLQQLPLPWHMRSWLGPSWRLGTGKTSAVVALPHTCMTTLLRWAAASALRK